MARTADLAALTEIVEAVGAKLVLVGEGPERPRIEEAIRQLQLEASVRLLGLRNDVGLLSEEYDPGQKRLLGNFPQAFSHVSLINTAHNLSHAEKPSEQRAG